MRRVLFVCATRETEARFHASSPLAASLRRCGECTPVALRLFASNAAALGACYNAAIAEAQSDDVLVFVHDDVHLDDWAAALRVAEALGHFDVVGVAGNRRRHRGQRAWHLQPARAEGGVLVPECWDKDFLSGAVAHGVPGAARVTVYGPTPAPVRLLDGVFLAARAQRLREAGVRFDPGLGFHFYDLDLCRSAEQAGLSLGTWPVALTHASAGQSILSDAWERACAAYLAKWGEV